MSDDAQSWLKVLGSAGVIALFGRACEGAFRWFVRRPLEKAERARTRAEQDADHWRAQYLAVAAEFKANTRALLRAKRADEIASGAPPDSLPPMRDELPTLQCIVESPPAREWAERRERAVETRAPRRIIETYSPTARPTLPAPAGFYPDAPVSLAPPFPPPSDPPPRAPRPRKR